MNERDRNEPEFWGGHSLRDDCDWVSYPGGVFYDFHMLVHAYRRIPKMDYYKDLADSLEDYLDYDEGQPRMFFGDGDVFRMQDYPKGTIIHFGIIADKPRSLLGTLRREFRQDEDVWGFIVQDEYAGQYYDLIVGWSIDEGSRQADPYIPDYLFSNLLMDEIVIGDTNHSRYLEPTLNYPSRLLGLNRVQSLWRINRLEVWKFGTEVREQLKETSPVGQLQPETRVILQ